MFVLHEKTSHQERHLVGEGGRVMLSPCLLIKVCIFCLQNHILNVWLEN